jgi:hypothetical protein
MQSNQINDRDIMINSVKEIIKKLLEW